MNKRTGAGDDQQLIPFDRSKMDQVARIRLIGSGSIGGKAQGLALLDSVLTTDALRLAPTQIACGIPKFTVICTDVFDEFVAKNDLKDIGEQGLSDDRIAHAFLNGELPFNILGDLRALIEQVQTPLAIRSSSLLEDAAYQPFAGVYSTKMIPNHQHEPGLRFQKLNEAIKYIYASTFFKDARSYRIATRQDHSSEKMAVIIQDVVGKRHGLRFYPEVSGVARSYNFYPVGRAKQEDGVVSLALGLGKTIVDGGISWTYSPAYPKIGPPYGSTSQLLKESQKDYWAINMGTPLVYDPIQETEYLVHENITTAEVDGTLRHLCSTYDPQSDRMQIGIGNPGPRALTFAPLLTLGNIPFNNMIKSVLTSCEEELNSPVEIEFAMTMDPPELGLLQVRPMIVSNDQIQIHDQDLTGSNTMAASENTLGNGVIKDIHDIVYVIPEEFELDKTRTIAAELAEINTELVGSGRQYLLIVFGRLGSSDPWLGIPVNWGQISGTKVIIETYREGFSADMSQGSHFFHNMTSLQVSFFSMPISGKYQIDWDWLKSQQMIQQTKFARHVRVEKPLFIAIDGRSGRGVILKSRDNNE